MLVFPQWRPDTVGDGCRIQRWIPAERLAPYVAKTMVSLPPPQVDDEDSSGASSPENSAFDYPSDATTCGWRGCGARFPSVARLSAHVARVHAVSHRDGMFYCGWKGCTRPMKGFNARYKMLVHVRTHTNERPHTCNQCSKSFSRAENLKIHLRSHSGEKPYVCTYEGCGKAYSNSSDRFKHTRTHTVEKPYFCKVLGCNKRYTDPSSLRKHVKTYKHFTPKETDRRIPSDDLQNSEPYLENSRILEDSPQMTIPFNQRSMSPTISPYSTMLPLPETIPPMEYPIIDRMTYIRPMEPLYPIRLPPTEMSYMEYTQMYEHAYRNYYTNYPVLRTLDEKSFSYEERPISRIDDVTMEVKERELTGYSDEEMPLNLICDKRVCTPMEELIRRTDVPLDLSTRVNI